MAIFATLWKFRTLIAVGLAVALIAVLSLRIGSLKNDVETARSELNRMTGERDKAIAVANANAAAVEEARQERDQTVALLESQRVKDAQRQATIEKVYKEIHNAPKSDCPAGPRLTAADRGLRELVETADDN